MYLGMHNAFWGKWVNVTTEEFSYLLIALCHCVKSVCCMNILFYKVMYEVF